MAEPLGHPLWDAFWAWAEEHGYDSDYEDDWAPWWFCFLAGADAESDQ